MSFPDLAYQLPETLGSNVRQAEKHCSDRSHEILVRFYPEFFDVLIVILMRPPFVASH